MGNSPEVGGLLGAPSPQPAAHSAPAEKAQTLTPGPVPGPAPARRQGHCALNPIHLALGPGRTGPHAQSSGTRRQDAQEGGPNLQARPEITATTSKCHPDMSHWGDAAGPVQTAG